MNNAKGNRLPYLGKIAAGCPLETIENPEKIHVPECLQSSGACYVLTVTGNTMVEMGLVDGDMVIIEKCHTAETDDIVVAIIDSYEATLKRYENTGAITLLHSANSEIKPFIFETSRVKIWGKVVGKMGRYINPNKS